ncbi:hypothetical protein FN976_25710 [Caenimonas sedimenti]|uniref:Uncharacterized protein n=1 Tax=Caenimonas sedimenti TaxID=2596921 RepID=A0A562ZHW5_9BURK|nr:hypothetical protein [Caenimonas sedimenti]TWO67784.1 hypothetical protein FN976_25710 [Caenimonas sedimenti]
MKPLLTALLATLGSSALAAQQCNRIPDDTQRLACYDELNGKVFAPAPAPAAGVPATAVPASNTAATSSSTSIGTAAAATSSEPAGYGWGRFIKDLKIADESTPKGMGQDPATFAAARRDGQEYASVKAALIWEMSESPFPRDQWFGSRGWGPWVGLSINRNTLVAKRTDTREANVGLSGIVFSINGEKPSFLELGMATRISATYRENKVEGTHSNLFRVESILTSDRFRGGLPYTGPGAWFFAPKFGWQREDIQRAKAGAPSGEYTSAYAIAKLEVYPAKWSERLRMTAMAQRAHDLSTDGGLAKRRETFAKLGLEYLLYSPSSTDPVQPSLALERTTGADLLNGAPKFGQTQLVFKLKVN